MIVAAVGFYFTKQEDAPCKGDDENAKYERDDEGECVYMGCLDGYAVDEDGVCVFDQSGKDCEGSDPNAIYETNVSNVCSFVMCNYGYNIGEDGNCVVAEEDGDAGGDTGGDTGGGADAAPVPVNCVGEWEDRHGFCDLGCGTAMETTFYYDIKTSAAHGGDACPHAQDATETQNCDLPSCPTVDTTETINGVNYDVKYYDSADGHSAYMVVYTYDLNYPKNTAYWNGQMVAEIGDIRYVDTDVPVPGSDGHGYIRGDKKKGPHGTKSNYVVKRSQEPMNLRGTCVLNKATEYRHKLDGRSDYECAGMCGGMTSKSACETPYKGCDYIRDGVPSYEVTSRIGTVLSSACKWILDGETQEIVPRWEVESDFWSPKKVDGTFLKTVDGVEMGIYYTKDEARDKTENKCLKECFNDPECTGVNTIFPLSGEGNKCELFTGDLDFSRNGNSWTGARGFKIERRYE
jgi:hypothetical protein